MRILCFLIITIFSSQLLGQFTSISEDLNNYVEDHNTNNRIDPEEWPICPSPSNISIESVENGKVLIWDNDLNNGESYEVRGILYDKTKSKYIQKASILLYENEINSIRSSEEQVILIRKLCYDSENELQIPSKWLEVSYDQIINPQLECSQIHKNYNIKVVEVTNSQVDPGALLKKVKICLDTVNYDNTVIKEYTFCQSQLSKDETKNGKMTMVCSTLTNVKNNYGVFPKSCEWFFIPEEIRLDTVKYTYTYQNGSTTSYIVNQVCNNLSWPFVAVTNSGCNELSYAISSATETALSSQVQGYIASIFYHKKKGTNNLVSLTYTNSSGSVVNITQNINGQVYLAPCKSYQITATYQTASGYSSCNFTITTPCPVVDPCESYGQSCNDNDPCTINDSINSDCNCEGLIASDSDNDGIPDSCDACPNEYGQMENGCNTCDYVGQGCNDGDDCTINDIVTESCGCLGQAAPDSDNDGVCDVIDSCPNGNDTIDIDGDSVPDACDDCPYEYGELENGCNTCEDVGQTCDDGNVCTINDIVTETCGCIGQLAPDSDNDGFCDVTDSCPNGNDSIDSDGDSIPDACDDCPNEYGEFENGCNTCEDVGQTCDDGNDCTINDIVTETCGCIGLLAPDSDNDGVCDVTDSCPNGNDSIDSDGDSIPDGCDDCPNEYGELENGCNTCDDVGQACNDGDDCTINDIVTETCGCIGLPAPDSDNDGVCDVTDSCPNGNDSIDSDGDSIPDACDDCPNEYGELENGCNTCDDVGQACNDGDDCTINDIVTETCGCVGQAAPDSDNDGVCDVIDSCPNGNDTIDIDGDSVPDACDDCPNEYGELANGCDFCLNVGGQCDDGNDCTNQDMYNENCECTGTSISDSDNDGICDEDDECPGFDDTIDINNNGVPDGCDEEPDLNIDILCKFFSLMQGVDVNYPNVLTGIWEIEDITGYQNIMDSLEISLSGVNNALDKIDKLDLRLEFWDEGSMSHTELIEFDLSEEVDLDFIENWSISLSHDKMYDSIQSNLVIEIEDEQYKCESSETILIYEEENHLLPELECGKEYEFASVEEDIDLDIRPGDLVHVMNFPILVTSIQSIDHSTGATIGKGQMFLPFKGNRFVQIEINEIIFNTEHNAIGGGDITGTSGYQINELPQLDIVTIDVDADMCKAPPVDENSETGGFDPLNGLNAHGFYENGVHSITGTQYNPYGFNINGIHQHTDTTYDENGCTIDNVHHETGEPCNNTIVPPVLHQVFKDSILNQSNGIIPDSLIFVFNLIQGEIQNELDVDCSSIKTQLLSLPLNGISPELYFGEEESLIGPDMLNLFERQPQPFYIDESQRDPIQTQRETLHIDYYNCVDSFTIFQNYFNTIQTIHPSNGTQELQNLINFIESQIDALDIATFNFIQDPSQFSSWLYTQIQSYISQNTEFPDDIGSINEEITPNDDWRNLSSQYVATTHSFRDDKLQELLFQYQQGFDKIGGIERPFITEALYKTNLATAGPNGNSALPLAISNEIEGYSYTVYVDNITLGYGIAPSIDAAIIVTDPNSNKRIAFAGENIPLSPSGIGESARLWLLSDQELRINNTSKLVLVGTDDNTYIDFDCNGFLGGGVEARVEFCSEYINPLNQSGEINEEMPYSLNFVTEFSKWLDFKVSIKGDPFVLKPLPNYKWSVDTLTLDYSSLSNTLAELPLGYTNKQYIIDSSGVGGYFVPDWRGFIMQGLEVEMPPQLQSNISYTIGIETAIFDRYGFSGEIFVEKNLVDYEEGNMDGWPFSLDRLQVIILQNQIKGGGFGGKLGISIAEKPFDYKATIVAKNNYQFKVINNEKDNSFPVFKANVNLDDNSCIHATYTEETGFSAIANLSGNISLNLDSFPTLKLPRIKFQQFKISNKPDYMEAGTWGVEGFTPGTSPGWNAFGISVDSIYPYRQNVDGPETVRLGIDFSVDVVDTLLVAKGGIDLLGNLNLESPIHKYNYHSVAFRHFCISGTIKDKFHLNGCVEVYKGDEKFGDGWRGGLQVVAKLSEKFTLDVTAAAQFGNVRLQETGEEHKYFFVDMLVDTGKPIPLGPLAINKLGGGLSKGMYPNYDLIDPLLLGEVIQVDSLYGYPLGTTLTGIPYEPDPAWGLEFKLLTEFQFELNAELCNGTGELKVRFNEGGGLGEIELTATAKMLASPPFISGFVTDAVGDVFETVNDVLPAIENLEAPDLEAKLSGYLNLTMNFNDGVFDGDLAAFLIGKNIHGYAPNKSMAWSKMHFSSEDWYIWIGTPTEPCGITLNTFVLDAKIKAYFDVGTIVPQFPGLPVEVAHLAKDIDVSEAQRSSGGGIAFGASITAGLELNAGIISLEVDVGGGFDILIRKYNQALCNGSTEFGINNWYAMGQFWAYIHGSIKAFGFNVAQAGITGVLQIQAPNPTYLYGAVEVFYNTPLGSGSKIVDMEIGEPCEWEFSNPSDEIGLDLIIDLTPFDNLDEVEVNVEPRATLAVSTKQTEYINNINYDFEINLDSTGVFWRGSKLASMNMIVNAKGDVIKFKPESTLPAKDSFYVKIMLDVFENGEYLASQSKEHIFYTADDLDYIPDDNIKYSYPIDGMMNFHRLENTDNQFFIYLDIGQPSLLENPSIVGKVCDSNMNCFESSITYYTNDHAVYMDIDPTLLTDQMNYMFYLRNPNYNISEDEEDPTISDGRISPIIYFRTSIFPTFLDKLIVTPQDLEEGVFSSKSPTRDLTTSSYIYAQFNGEPFDKVDIENGLVKMENPGTKPAVGLDGFYFERTPDQYSHVKFQISPIDTSVLLFNQTDLILPRATLETFENNTQLQSALKTYGTSFFYILDEKWSNLRSQFTSYFNYASSESGLLASDEENKKLWLGENLYNDYESLKPGSTSTTLSLRYVLPNGRETTNTASNGINLQYIKTYDYFEYLSKF